MIVGRKYKITGYSESHRPELTPNGRIVTCIEDQGEGFYVVESDEDIEPNVWLIDSNIYYEEINF